MQLSTKSRSRRLQLRMSDRRLLVVIGDVIAVLLSVLGALWLWAFVADDPFTAEFVMRNVMWFFILAGLWLLLASANDMYEVRITSKRPVMLLRLVRVSLQMIVVYVVVFFLSPRDALPRLFIMYYGIASFLLILFWRTVNPVIVGLTSEPLHTLIVGNDQATKSIIDAIHEFAASEYDLHGVICYDDAQVGGTVSGVPVIGTGVDLLNYVMRDEISEIIVTATPENAGDVFQGIMDAYERGVAIVPMPLLYEQITGRVPVEHINNDWAVVLPMDGAGVFDLYPFIKRALDIALSLVGLVLFAVLLPFLALAIKLNSEGDVFYTQDRVGLNGRIFRIYKLRSMIQDAEVETGAKFAEKDDPRVTFVGKILRKTRLDEVPQLVNVLRGDMSLIGPRPERPEHVQRLTDSIPFYRTRLVVLPGLTGWAQVRYGYGATDDDALVKLQYDLYYIRHQSLALDLTIILRTIGKVVTLGGQ